MSEFKNSDLILYTSEGGDLKIDVLMQDDDVWLTQKAMAELFGKTIPNINMHVSNVFSEGELQKDSTIKESLIVQKEGNREVERNIEFYNLDVIISVGYRVKSHRGTQFRIWATKLMREYARNGYILNEKRLAEDPNGVLQALMVRIHAIRASEKVIYQKIRDLFAICSTDYDKNSEKSKEFFATAQNKFLYANTGKTAAEIIDERADSQKENMGMTTWQAGPGGRIYKADTQIAKNYLSEAESKLLELSIAAFLINIEYATANGNRFTMAQFTEKVDEFLISHDRKVLEGKGTVKAKEAFKRAEREYNKFDKTQQAKKIGKAEKTETPTNVLKPQTT